MLGFKHSYVQWFADISELYPLTITLIYLWLNVFTELIQCLYHNLGPSVSHVDPKSLAPSTLVAEHILNECTVSNNIFRNYTSR